MKFAPWLLSLSLLFQSTAFGAPQRGDYEMRALKLSNGAIVYLDCQDQTCNIIGSKTGYEREDLKMSPKLSQSIAITLGTLEVGTAAVATVITAVSAFMTGGLTVVLVGTLANQATMAAAILTPAALVGLTATLFKWINPIHHWNQAKTKETIQPQNLEYRKQLIVQFNDSRDYEDFISNVERLLRKIKPSNKRQMLPNTFHTDEIADFLN